MLHFVRRWLPLLSIAVLGTTPAAAEPVAIVGATLIDVRNFGHDTGDIVNAVVVLDGDSIIAAGPASQVAVPPRARRIDGRGAFVIPGLIDGTGALRTQAFANAYLYEGVTSVYIPQNPPGGTTEGEDKPPFAAAPAPRLLLAAPVTGYSTAGTEPANQSMTEHRLHDTRLTHAQLVARVDDLAAHGFRGVAIGHDVWPDQVDAIVAAAHRRGLATSFELGFTSYPYAIRAGVAMLSRLDRYQAAFASLPDQLTYADSPQSPAANKPIFVAICGSDPASPAVAELAALLAASHTAIMPVTTLEATADQLGVPNPWTARSAALIDAADLDNPPDRAGRSVFLTQATPERRDRLRACAQHKLEIDHRLHELGARFLAASGTPAFGVMPGSGLHVELALLVRSGLTPREALAAATSNFADVYGWADLGRIEPGRRADLVVLDADPRLDIAAVDRIRAVIAKGVVLDRPALLLRPRK